jgi:hypothetical protein
MPACRDIPYVLEKLNWMRAERIWPNGQRYTWTDALGIVLLVSLYEELAEPSFLDEAEWVVSDVDRVLGRPRGIRIGEAPDRDGQYFHYLAMWLYALSVLARHVPAYRRKGIDLVNQIHPVIERNGIDAGQPLDCLAGFALVHRWPVEVVPPSRASDAPHQIGLLKSDLVGAYIKVFQSFRNDQCPEIEYRKHTQGAIQWERRANNQRPSHDEKAPATSTQAATNQHAITRMYAGIQ